MSSNSKVVLLLISVIGIWGLIGYKIMASLEQPSYSVPQRREKKQIVEEEPLLELRLDYADPFLATDKKQNIPVSHQGTLIVKKRTPKVESETRIIMNWDKLVFLGGLSNAVRGELFAVVKIDGIEFIIKEGGEAEGFTVSKIYKDSVLVKFHSESKVLKRIK